MFKFKFTSIPPFDCLWKYPELREAYYVKVVDLGERIIKLEKKVDIRRKGVSLALVRKKLSKNKDSFWGSKNKELRKEYLKYCWSNEQLNDYSKRLTVLEKIV